MKRCARCRVEKPITEFNRNKQTRDGLAVYCKSCRHVQRIEHAARTPREAINTGAKRPSCRIETPHTEFKRCIKCGLEKSRSEFHKAPQYRDGLKSKCKSCIRMYQSEHARKPEVRERKRQYMRERYRFNTEHREYMKLLSRKNHHKNPEKARDVRLRREFGITLAEYRMIEVTQSGGCAICGKKCNTGNNLAVDHDHLSGQIRGLLCQKCNHAVGLLGDDPELMYAAAEYVLRGRDVLREIG